MEVLRYNSISQLRLQHIKLSTRDGTYDELCHRRHRGALVPLQIQSHIIPLPPKNAPETPASIGHSPTQAQHQLLPLRFSTPLRFDPWLRAVASEQTR